MWSRRVHAEPATRISEKQVADLEARISEVGGNRDVFLKYIKVVSLEDILAEKYPTVVKLLLRHSG